MKLSLVFLTALSAVVQCTPLAYTNASTPAARDTQPWYMFDGGRIPDASQSISAPKRWPDPYDYVPRGYFTIVVESGQVNVFAQAIGPRAPHQGFFATSFAMCKHGVATTNQHGSSDWIDVGATPLVFNTLYVHAGNQCKFKLRDQQFDNTWLLWRGTLYNLPTDNRCKDVVSSMPVVIRSRRCVLPL